MTDLIAQVRRLLERLPADSEVAKRMQRAGIQPADINALDDLARIPILKKEDLPLLQRQEGALARALPFGGLASASRVFYSPAGIFDFEARQGRHWRADQAVRAARIGAGDILLNTFSYHMTPAARMFEDSAIAAGAVVVPSGPGQIPIQLDIMRRLGVTAFVGLPSFLNMLIDAAIAQGLDWKKEFRLTRAIVGAEPISVSARRRFEQDFGIELFTVYGTADLGIVGYECESHDGWHVDDDLIVQICEPDSGIPLGNAEIGEVVATLAREFYPLVRFATGDLSRIESARCACGRPGIRLMGVLGRTNQTVKVRGMFVYPAFAQQIAQAHDWVASVRIRVEREGESDRMRVLVLPKAGAAVPADLSTLEESVRGVTKLRGNVEVVEEAIFRQSDKVIEDVRKWD
ncbi:phenylacetate--CoA ligase family protein [Noviherbaspirillum malthae]|uniref:phenylacetate--CoA ligase family protein n=1 Tax=Noviherbaspirillum malthae TaxID=1260987 RepID=UPI0018908B04|nr:AMP-binding protein [Noviherbaspirillum malthae]